MSDPIEKLKLEGKLGTVEQAISDGERSSLPPPPKTGAPGRRGGFGLHGGHHPRQGAPAQAPRSAEDPQLEVLAKLREPSPPNYISSLPKQTKRQKDDVEKNKSLAIRCALCGGWHHKDAPHVPYVGHAAVTDKLLSVDPFWHWEPVAWTPEGLPRFDASGGMWIKLTVGGITRLGYGHGAQKPNQDPGAREKEVIGDALRNAAMRFGVALELWHKGDLHTDEDTVDENTVDDNGDPVAKFIAGAPEGTFINDEQRDRICDMCAASGVEARAICDRYGIDSLPQLHADEFEAVMNSLKLTIERRRKPEPAGDGVLDDSVRF